MRLCLQALEIGNRRINVFQLQAQHLDVFFEVFRVHLHGL